MKRLVAVIIICAALSGCLTPVQPATLEPEEVEQIAAKATQIVLNQATQTITPTATATASPQPAAEIPVVFRDDFNSTLRPGWTWVNENNDNWSLQAVPGSLQIKVDSGFVIFGNVPNLLLRPAPASNFLIETSLLFTPKDNNQFAGLILYESNENFIQAGNSYCNPINECVGQGLYFDVYLNGNLLSPRSINKVKLDSAALRVVRQGNLFSFYASPNGKAWYLITKQEADIDVRQVGLMAGQNMDTSIPKALFDYFEINKVE